MLNKAVLRAINAARKAGYPKLAAQIRRTSDASLWPPKSVDVRVADDLRRKSVNAVGDELDTTLLRRVQRGKPVPAWFDAVEGGALSKYNVARARSGFGGQGGDRVPLRSPADASARLGRVKENVGAANIPRDKIRRIQELCGVDKDPRVCGKVSAMIEREIGFVRQLGSYNTRQHAWNVMPDGTVVDATASQFGLPAINVVPRKLAKRQNYRPHSPKIDKFMDDYKRLSGRSPDDYDLMMARENGYDAMRILREQGML